jgi:hypothetical protein
MAGYYRTSRIKALLFFVTTAAAVLSAGCSTTGDSAGYTIDTQLKRSIKNNSFFILKGNLESYINNLDFALYADLLRQGFEAKEFQTSSYGEAEMFILLEYGVEGFPSVKYRRHREYNPDTRVTTWVHEEKDVITMAFVKITAIEGNPYRNIDEKNVLWELVVKNPDHHGDPRAMFSEMIESAYPRIGK